MTFPAFKMAAFTAQWPAGSLTSIHSSNPEPLTWGELNELTQSDVIATLKQSTLGYESTQGNEALRQLICEQYYPNSKTNHLVLTAGAQEGIFLVMQALLSKEDEVVAITPCFEPLVQEACNAGANVKTCELQADNDWQIDWDQLSNLVSNQTKLLIINFPHNPTGCHITQTELQRLQDLCRRHDCWLFSDEVFRGLEHDVNKRIQPAVKHYEKAISMGVMSKALALPGIRLGWLACQNIDLIKTIINIKSHLSICQSSLDVKLSQIIIPHSESIWDRNKRIILENKAKLASILENNENFLWTAPKASATAFIQLKNSDGNYFAQSLADNKKLLVLPNEVFLTRIPGFRISLGYSELKDLYTKMFSHTVAGNS